MIKKFSSEDINRLEESILTHYVRAIYTQKKAEHEQQRKVFPEKPHSVIQGLLELIALSDPNFRPLKWGVNDHQLHQKFNALYENHAQVLNDLKTKIEAVVTKNYNGWKEGTYYKDRLKLKPEDPDSWKPFFAKEPQTSREDQVHRLQAFLGDGGHARDLAYITTVLRNVKREIGREWNIWDSELLKQINQVIREVVNPEEEKKDTNLSFEEDQENFLDLTPKH